MAVPDYQSLMLPLLRLAADGREHTQTETVAALAERFRLTDQEQRQLLPSGTQPLFYNRVHWARSYLKHAGLLERTGRGRFRITALGQEVAASNPERVDDQYLRRFAPFVDFQRARRPARGKRGDPGARATPAAAETVHVLGPTDTPPADSAPTDRLPGRALLEAAVLAALAREPEGLASSAILDAVPSSFPHLSPAALALRTPDGRDQLLRYNAMWARQFLEWRGLIRKVRRRVYAITPEGMALIGRAAGSDGSVDLTALAAHFKTRPNRPVSAEGSPGGATAASKRAEAVPAAASGEGARRTDGPAPVRSFADAAEFVLDRFGGGQPMHYRAITRKALELGLVVTRGRTPEQTLYAQVLADIDRRERSGEPPRFVRHGRGMVALSRSVPVGLAAQIERHNARVREQLHARMLAIPPGEFETLVGELLAKLGFQDVEVTARSGDGGIDVRGTLVVGEVIRTRMAVQVKRWRANNVQAPTVQQVRGSLGTHDQGLIITTSDFSAGARTEAERPNAVPVALMNGTQLVDLLIQEGIGIRRASYELIDLEEGAEGSDAVTQDARRGAPGR